MKIFQSPLLSKRTSILSIPENTYVEIKNIDSNFMYLKIRCKISLTNVLNDPREYEKVVIYLSNDTSPVLQSSVNSIKNNNVINPITKLQTNSIINPTPKINSEKLSPIYPKSISEKLLDGKSMLQTLIKQEEYLSPPYEISISSWSLNSSLTNSVSTIDLSVPEKQPVRKTYPSGISNINSRELIFRINRNIQDITSPADEKNITSESDLYGKIFSSDNSQFSQLYTDMLKYYLSDVKKSEFEDSSQWYEQTRISKKLDYFVLETNHDIQVPVINKNSRIKIRFDLYKKDSNIPDESQTKIFSASDHVAAYYSLKKPPIVRFNNNEKANKGSYITGNSINISIHDQENNGNISGYHVYLKSIDRLGNAESYKKVKQTSNSSSNNFSIQVDSKLSVVRVVPLEIDGKESNLFTNVVIGPGYDEIGNLTIIPYYLSNANEVYVEAHNIPKTASSAVLYRRDCSSNTGLPFEEVSYTTLAGESEKCTFSDVLVPGKIFEYYVCVLSTAHNDIKENNKKYVSNFVHLKHPISNVGNSPPIKVVINNFNSSSDINNDISISFDIKVSVTPDENKKIIDAFKSQLGELYSQFLDPAHNQSSPLNDGNYADIIMHEVVRTNLNTAEREVFDIVSAGTFQDNQSSQSIANIKKINPQYSYIYQIFSYRRDPITLFKNYIAVPSPASNRFYLPYKWKNPTVVATGKLYSEDINGIPIIDLYDALTSQSYGLTASYNFQGSTQLTQLKNIIASRLDINTVRVSWSYSGITEHNKISLYDSFVVMKVVNGIRSFVGRTHKNFIYHEIDKKDLGSVYYIIVPIMNDFSIDDPGYSNEIFIDVDGLIKPVLIPTFHNN